MDAQPSRKGPKDRPDDFETRRKHLEGLGDEELRERFWSLAREVVAPLVRLARTHTSPSIERSVLLRMGIDSVKAQEVVRRCAERGLLGHGAGNVVLRYAKEHSLGLRKAAEALSGDDAWEEVVGWYGGVHHGARS
ncbi:MAG: ornithine aminomutase subunit alpha [Firmicutes bacterium]|nr:ornithine aminomutase subunit alpha [Bacillota bacterium]